MLPGCSDFPKKIMLPPPSLVVKIKSTRKERPVNAKSSSDETDKKCDKVNMEEEKNTATVESERKLSSGLRRRSFSRKGKQKTRDYIPSLKSRTKTGNRTETKSLFPGTKDLLPFPSGDQTVGIEQNFRGPRVWSSHKWGYKQINKQTRESNKRRSEVSLRLLFHRCH